MEEPTRRTRRTYDEQFNLDAVLLVTEGGRSMNSVARELGIAARLLRKWRDKLTNGVSSTGKSKVKTKSAEQIENEKLRRELARVIEEREILKKALAVFSRRHGRSTNLSKNGARCIALSSCVR
jgi:transposase